MFLVICGGYDRVHLRHLMSVVHCGSDSIRYQGSLPQSDRSVYVLLLLMGEYPSMGRRGCKGDGVFS